MARVHIYHEDAKAIRDELAIDAIPLETKGELESALGEIEILFAAMPPRTGWTRAKRLRLLQVMGAGVDQLLPSPDLPESVAIAGARGVFADEAAEHAVAMMLALVRALPAQLARQRDRIWRQFEVGKLAGRTMTLLGLGEIGQRVARIATAMDMNVLGVSKHARPVPNVRSIALPSDMTRVLAAADFLVVCLPLTPETKGLVGEAAIGALPALASVVSLGRGGIVDERALLAALRDGKVGGAALDVFDEEPLPKTSPWWTAPNAIVTPHIAGAGVDYVRRCATILTENVRRLERGEPLLNLVDRARGY